MSGLVKASAVSLSQNLMRIAQSSARLDDHATVQEPERDDPAASLQQRIGELETQLREQSELAQRREQDAYDKGFKEGADKAARDIRRKWDREAEAVVLAAKAARERFEASLPQLESLSLDLAEAALSRIVGDTNQYAALLAQSMAFHLRGLEQSIIHVAVSARDFPDAESLGFLETLSERLRRSIEVREELPAGACRVSLTLGHLDLDVSSQRDRLSSAFAALGAHD